MSNPIDPETGYRDEPEPPEPERCGRWLCDNAAECTCDNCGNVFCGDHGTPGGDVQVENVGAVARPSACWECGGFDVDTESDEEDKRYAAGDAAFTMAYEEGEI